VVVNGSGFAFRVGLGSIGRGSFSAITFPDHQFGNVSAYTSSTVQESFQSTSSGIEQSFNIAKKPAGDGLLEIGVGVSGLRAEGAGTSIALTISAGQAVASYSSLSVTDAAGQQLPAHLGTSDNGRTITISIDDSGADYPITIDPTYSENYQLLPSDGANYDESGISVAISGDTAVVGSRGHAVSGHGDQGAAYVFTLSGGTWSQTAELTASDGAANDQFGTNVAISGNTIVVGASNHTVSGHSYQGAAYVFSLSGGTWSQTAELIASDGAASDYFGASVSISGSVVAVGAYGHTVSGHADQGAVYVYELSGGTWSQTAELTSSDGAANDGFWQVSVSGSNIIVGAYGHTVSGHADQGAAYIFS
jgi:hypothetical protein